jgi:hypothetical protein
MQSWREIIADAVQQPGRVRELKRLLVAWEDEVRRHRDQQLAENRLVWAFALAN